MRKTHAFHTPLNLLPFDESHYLLMNAMLHWTLEPFNELHASMNTLDCCNIVFELVIFTLWKSSQYYEGLKCYVHGLCSQKAGCGRHPITYLFFITYPDLPILSLTSFITYILYPYLPSLIIYMVKLLPTKKNMQMWNTPQMAKQRDSPTIRCSSTWPK